MVLTAAMPALEPNENLAGKVVLVTGGARGLGATLVRAAAGRGARVVVNFRSNGDAAEALANELRPAARELLLKRADVADFEQARALVEDVLAAMGRIDVLVNAVGGFLWRPVESLEPAEWRATIASNLDSVYNMCRLVLPAMRQRHFGRIVNIGAVGADTTVGQPEVAAYSAAKSAVVAFSKCLALEVARSGITVNVVCPGAFVDGGEGMPDGARARLAERVPVGRPGAPDDIARAVFFFASPAADFLTGQVLDVAGGWRL